MSAATGSLPMEDLIKNNPNYFQVTQPVTKDGGSVLV